MHFSEKYKLLSFKQRCKSFQIVVCCYRCPGHHKNIDVTPKLDCEQSLLFPPVIARKSSAETERKRRPRGEWGGWFSHSPILHAAYASALDFRARYYTITGGKRRDCSQSTPKRESLRKSHIG